MPNLHWVMGNKNDDGEKSKMWFVEGHTFKYRTIKLTQIHY